jgi:ribosomal protein L11 methyltransferase
MEAVLPKVCPIKDHILALLGKDRIRMTPSDLINILHRQLPDIARSALRNTIKTMVSEGVLVYTNHLSTTHLEVNFNRPLKVSERVILCPAVRSFPKSGNAVIIKLQDGAAFGMGDHPTTRLCIKGLDHALAEKDIAPRLARMIALDIGTGSAVLAMVAVGLGIGWAKGIDIDPLACVEAHNNVVLNRMTDRVTITNEPLSVGDVKRYDVILANLRPPTLKQLFPIMEKVSNPEALWVLSGFRQEQEIGDGLLLGPQKARIIWRSIEQGWAGLALQLNPVSRSS